VLDLFGAVWLDVRFHHITRAAPPASVYALSSVTNIEALPDDSVIIADLAHQARVRGTRSSTSTARAAVTGPSTPAALNRA
jgi:hypothetical protein